MYIINYNGLSCYVPNTPDTSHFSPPSDPSLSAMSSDKTHEMLEEENDKLMDETAHKIHALKNVSNSLQCMKL